MLRGTDRYVVLIGLMCLLFGWGGKALAERAEMPQVVFLACGTETAKGARPGTDLEKRPFVRNRAGQEPNPAIPLSGEEQRTLLEACEAEGVELALALAVAEQESGFDPAAVNGDCVGYMQIKVNPRTLDYFQEAIGADPRLPLDNLRCGVHMLGDGLRTYGGAEAALTVYRWGEQKAAELGFCCTYSTQVLAAAERWRLALEAE